MDVNDIKESTINFAIMKSLKLDVYSPLRIIWGYNGFVSDKGMKSAFLEILREDEDTLRYGLGYLPNITIAGNKSIVKMNGFPYTVALDDGTWNCLCYNRKNPIRIVIECLWHKITSKLNMSMIWLPNANDLVLEQFFLYSYAKYKKIGESKGEFKVEFALNESSPFDMQPQWEPLVVSTDELAIIVASNGVIDLDDKELVEFASSHDVNLNAMLKRLVRHRSFLRRSDRIIETRFDEIHNVYTTDGTIAVSHDLKMLLAWLNDCEEKIKKNRDDEGP